MLCHATCVSNNGPTGEFSRVREVHVRSAPIKICLWSCLGKDDTRSTYLPSAPQLSRFFCLNHFYHQTFTSLPKREWKLVNFLLYLKAPSYLPPSVPLALPKGRKKALARYKNMEGGRDGWKKEVWFLILRMNTHTHICINTVVHHGVWL